ncbi:SAM-dependent methyltransferase [Fulvivirga lutea]|uniref:SAM-dependent methyltransferase n=1 Tax=Fulvivirga lutea TaxID=2810512 RepID=A0A975A159_9BACT|nr:SAM-dependent methyltransferase [Fulvivirga lutea]QSE97956.1 SAM-dependent methyltransferase [Fulvivirga lutea]
MKGKLFLIPTVIAESEQDTIPEQVKEIIKNTEYYLVENVRTARRYISSLKLGLTIEDLNFEILDKKTDYQKLGKLLAPLSKGTNVGIISESGCPGVADPGALAVEWAQKNHFQVVPLVGPSSILMALMGSGFNGQKFCFHGYLPIDKKELEKEIKALEAESSKKNQTQIFIETPYRNNQLLTALSKTCHPSTKICVAKDISGKDEFVVTDTAANWQKREIDLHKIPTVFLLYAGK